jgi:hypothetical protein
LTKTSGKRKGYRKYSYYICGGYQMNGRTVCQHRLLAREALEKPVLDALGRRLRDMGQMDRLRARIADELRAGVESDACAAETLPAQIADVETRIKRWEAAIEKGVNVDTAVAKINDLLEQKERLEAKGPLRRCPGGTAAGENLLQRRPVHPSLVQNLLLRYPFHQHLPSNPQLLLHVLVRSSAFVSFLILGAPLAACPYSSFPQRLSSSASVFLRSTPPHF